MFQIVTDMIHVMFCVTLLLDAAAAAGQTEGQTDDHQTDVFTLSAVDATNRHQSPKLHPGTCSSVGMRRDRQTDTHMAVTDIHFVWL